MTGWANSFPLFEGEDEEALKSRFVELCAKHRNRYPPEQVALFVFKDLPDNQMRALQAAQVWANDLDVQERIRQLMVSGNDEELPSRQKLVAMAMSIAEDPLKDTKDRLKAIELMGQLQGLVVKAVDKTVDDKRKPVPQVVYARYDD